MNPGSDATWFLQSATNEGHEGPYSLNDLAGRIARKEIETSRLVWRNGMEGWLPILNTPEFSSVLSGEAPEESARACCLNHPDKSASWQCPSCERLYCEDCVRRMKTPAAATAQVALCPHCEGVGCMQIGVSEDSARPTFVSMLSTVLGYPLRQGAWRMLVIGTLFFGFIDLAVMMLGPYGLVVAGFGAAFLLAYVFKIIYASASGKHELPKWPNMHELAWPAGQACQVIAIGLLGPLGLILLAPFVHPALAIVGFLLLPIGALYMPMGMLSAALGQHTHKNPIETFRTAFKVFPAYLITLVALSVIVVVNYMAKFSTSIGLPGVVAHLTCGAISLYLTVVKARLLGLVYYTNEPRFDWEVEKM